jgi:hypothetical protein
VEDPQLWPILTEIIYWMLDRKRTAQAVKLAQRMQPSSIAAAEELGMRLAVLAALSSQAEPNPETAVRAPSEP